MRIETAFLFDLDGTLIDSGLLSGGYGADELRQSGTIRVYDDPADLLRKIDEVAARR